MFNRMIIGSIILGSIAYFSYSEPVVDRSGLTSLITELTETKFTEDDINCLTDNVYHEARGEPWYGQRAVVEVVLNRMNDPRWPDTVCEVVYQDYAFSWTLAPVTVDDMETWYEIKSKVSSWVNDKLNWEANHYHTSYVDPEWDNNMEFVGQIGNHYFFNG